MAFRFLQSIFSGPTEPGKFDKDLMLRGIERVVDGEIEATSWYWAPPSQPEWMTDGLIDHGVRLREEDPTGD